MTERIISPVERQYLAIKRGEIIEQVMLSSLVLTHDMEHPDSLPKGLVERHKKAILGELQTAKMFGFKPSDICREVDTLLHPKPQESP